MLGWNFCYEVCLFRISRWLVSKWVDEWVNNIILSSVISPKILGTWHCWRGNVLTGYLLPPPMLLRYMNSIDTAGGWANLIDIRVSCLFFPRFILTITRELVGWERFKLCSLLMVRCLSRSLVFCESFFRLELKIDKCAACLPCFTLDLHWYKFGI